MAGSTLQVKQSTETLNEMLRIMNLHPLFDSNKDEMRHWRISFVQYLMSELYHDSRPHSWCKSPVHWATYCLNAEMCLHCRISDVPQFLPTIARIWLYCGGADQDDLERLASGSVNLFIGALRGISGFSGQDSLKFSIQAVTSYSYDRLITNYTKLVDTNTLSLDARVLQFGLYKEWIIYDESEEFHHKMCLALPRSVNLIQETSSNPERYHQVPDSVIWVWIQALRHPSDYNIAVAAKCVALGMVLFFGEWVMTLTEDRLCALHTYIIICFSFTDSQCNEQ